MQPHQNPNVIIVTQNIEGNKINFVEERNSQFATFNASQPMTGGP